MDNTSKLATIILIVAGVLAVIGFVIWLFIRPSPAQEPVQTPSAQNEPQGSFGSQPRAQTPTAPVQSPAGEAIVDIEKEYERLFGQLSLQRVNFMSVDSTQGEAGSVYALYEADVADARASFSALSSYPISVSLTDLDGDGTAEAIVVEDLPGYCGTAGCPVEVYRREGNSWSLLFSTLAGKTVGITSTKTNGYAELYLAQGNEINQYVWMDGTYSPWGMVAQWNGSNFVVVQ